MNPHKVIIFDIWGRYAHFKKIYVTTSALSYGVPFKTSIYGIVGAILGLDNHENKYLESFRENSCQIGIQVINPVRLIRINVNLSPSPGPIADNRKPTMMEFIVEPYYRIFFWHMNNQLMDDLSESLKNKQCVYTPVLGLAHCLANFKWHGETTLMEDVGETIIHTVIPKSLLTDFDQAHWADNEIHIQEQSMYPLEMNSLREVTKRESVLYDINGKALKAITKQHYQIALGEKTVGIMLM